MRLADLLQGLINSKIPDDEITHLSLDSRQITAHGLYIAIKGTHRDGADFIPAVIAQGAAAILTQGAIDSVKVVDNVTFITLTDLKNKLTLLGERFYNYPTKHLKLIGITGTNGKTSCSHYIAQLLTAANYRCGIIGTLGYGFNQELHDTGLTTPDALSLQKIFSELYTAHAQAVAMEVSSHSIHQKRVAGIPFSLGIFTNLTQDHLDYHGDMQTYAEVKYSFLNDPNIKTALINADDEYGLNWLSLLQKTKSVMAYACEFKKELTAIPQLYAKNIALSLTGIRASLHSPWGEGELEIPLIGLFNLSNALAAIAASCLSGVDFNQALKLAKHLQPVPGRMQRLGNERQPLVIVDYSHTPDSLIKALSTLRAHTHGKLICVFGAGGDRDHAKRPLMGAAVERYADLMILTNDNPRTENPQQIADEVAGGIKNKQALTVELDRSKAIEKSIQWASSNDCILIAGKGAERYQQIGNDKIPFSDAEEVIRYLG